MDHFSENGANRYCRDSTKALKVFVQVVKTLISHNVLIEVGGADLLRQGVRFQGQSEAAKNER